MDMKKMKIKGNHILFKIIEELFDTTSNSDGERGMIAVGCVCLVG
jgi:hypothetical protein